MPRARDINRQAKEQQILRDVISANPDIDPIRIAKIVKLTIMLVRRRNQR